MNVTILVGNGFDLNLNLKTQYTDFIKDYCKYYNEKEVIVRDNSEMQEVLYELYDNDVFEVKNEEKIIELFN